jgi:hypothetical protein
MFSDNNENKLEMKMKKLPGNFPNACKLSHMFLNSAGFPQSQEKESISR